MEEMEMPYLNLGILSITFDRDTDEVEVHFDGVNYLEALSLLTIAKNQIMDTPYEGEEDEDEDEETDY